MNEQECEQHIFKVLNEHKYVVLSMLDTETYTRSELLGVLKKLETENKLASIRVPYKTHTPIITIVLYTTIDYSYSPEPKAYLKSIGISSSAAVSYLNKLREKALNINHTQVRTERKKMTLKDLEYKGQIISYLNKYGPQDLPHIASWISIDNAHCRALLSSLSVSKSIVYDGKTKKYKSLTDKY